MIRDIKKRLRKDYFIAKILVYLLTNKATPVL